jgi:hypothetical protein
MKRTEARPPGFGRVLNSCFPDRAEIAGGAETIAETLPSDQMAASVIVVGDAYRGCVLRHIRYSCGES